MTILPAHFYFTMPNCARDRAKSGEGWGYDDLCPGRFSLYYTSDFACEFLALCLAAVHLPVANHQRDGHWLSSKAFTPGSSLPSRNSKVAPPPVDKWLIFSATPAAATAATVSPPAMMLTMRGKFSANALAKMRL